MSLGPLEQARIVLERAIARTSLSWKIVGAIGLALPVTLAALVGLVNGGSVEVVLGMSVVAYALLVFFIVFVVWASLGLLFMVRRIMTQVPGRMLLLLIPLYALGSLFALYVVNRFVVPLLTP